MLCLSVQVEWSSQLNGMWPFLDLKSDPDLSVLEGSNDPVEQGWEEETPKRQTRGRGRNKGKKTPGKNLKHVSLFFSPSKQPFVPFNLISNHFQRSEKIPQSEERQSQ